MSDVGLGKLLEEAALALASGDAVVAGGLLQKADHLCRELKAQQSQLSPSELAQATAAQARLAEIAPKLERALALAVKSAGTSRRAGKAYGGQ